MQKIFCLLVLFFAMPASFALVTVYNVLGNSIFCYEVMVKDGGNSTMVVGSKVEIPAGDSYTFFDHMGQKVYCDPSQACQLAQHVDEVIANCGIPLSIQDCYRDGQRKHWHCEYNGQADRPYNPRRDHLLR